MKHVLPLRFPAVFLALGAAAFAFALGPFGSRATAQTTPGLPPGTTPSSIPGASPAAVLGATAPPSSIPTSSPSPEPRRRGKGKPAAEPQPSPTETPTSPAFATLDGSWEMQLQAGTTTTYSYLDIKQSQQGISGLWRLNRNKDKYPFDGTYDGRLIRIVAKGPSGDIVLSGYVDGASDMVGTVDYGKGDPVAFTAEHRASTKSGNLLQKISPAQGPGQTH